MADHFDCCVCTASNSASRSTCQNCGHAPCRIECHCLYYSDTDPFGPVSAPGGGYGGGGVNAYATSFVDAAFARFHARGVGGISEDPAVIAAVEREVEERERAAAAAATEGGEGGEGAGAEERIEEGEGQAEVEEEQVEEQEEEEDEVMVVGERIRGVCDAPKDPAV